jgi:hypothetical protein
MLEYLEKFNKLPADIQQKSSSQEVLLALDDLSGRYKVDLAGFVMRVMVGELLFKNLLANLIKDFDLELEQAELLEAELRDRVFHRVQDYLLGTAKPDVPTKEEAIKVEHYVEVAEKTEGSIKKLPAGLEEKLLPSHAAAVKSSKPEVGKSFLEEDAKEIEAFKNNLPLTAENEAERYLRLSEDVLKETGLNFPSEGLILRFKQIITTYLRGIRTRIETRETMLKPVINGGLNLDVPETDRILAIAHKKIAEESKKNPALKNKVEEGPVGFILRKDEIDEALGKAPAKSSSQSMTGEPEYDLAAELKKGSVSTPADLQPVEKAPAANQRTAVATSGKKKIEDIKKPQTMSPIDELSYMDLVTFRRLDVDPARRCKKIEEKILLLGKEGIDKQLAGIKAWRLNPVNKTYLNIGQESISQGKNIDDVIVDLKTKGLNYLTRAEFEAIMDLNNRLRF